METNKAENKQWHFPENLPLSYGKCTYKVEFTLSAETNNPMALGKSWVRQFTASLTFGELDTLHTEFERMQNEGIVESFKMTFEPVFNMEMCLILAGELRKSKIGDRA